MRLAWTRDGSKPALPSSALLQLFEPALARQPHRWDLRLPLMRVRFRERHWAQVAALADAMWGSEGVSDEVLAEAAWLAGRASRELGDFEAASKLFTLACAHGGDAQADLAEGELAAGRADEALAMVETRLKQHPSDFAALSLAAHLLQRAGRVADLWNLCQELMRAGQTGGFVPSALFWAASSREQQAIAAALFDVSSNLMIGNLSHQLALAELADELARHPGAAALPPTNATLGKGRRIDALEVSAGPQAAKALDLIRTAVERYVTPRREAAHETAEPDACDTVSLRAWSISVEGDGHEAWHVHPEARVSGVLYIETPGGDLPEDPQPGAPGVIAFGPLPLGRGEHRRESILAVINPTPGRLLLFPSHFGHRTWPTGSNQRRTCIAFDVIPEPAPS